ncbi:MAG: aminomethyl-transferring glycine dehydrogenase subunit GcvPB [Pseudomonadota bacterium]
MPSSPLKSPGRSGRVLTEPLLCERSTPGRRGYDLEPLDVDDVDPASLWPDALRRTAPPALPEVSEVEVARHYTRLSTWNHAVDLACYPLGSCTMKYNPKINEWAARLPGFAGLHPYTPETLAQGALELMYRLAEGLKAITGFEAITLQPAAGAHGELTGIMMVRAALNARGEQRSTIVVTDSSHGTNPATAALNGYKVVSVPSGADGTCDVEAMARAIDASVAAVMLTNPNTLGVYEPRLVDIADLVHARGSYLYCDGANMNALLGKVQPARLGVDVMHLNLHKTFSTPHGGGGPGAGPVAVVRGLEPFLPAPLVVQRSGGYALDLDRPQSIGRVRSFTGNFGVLVRAYTYLRELGAPGLSRATELAVLNANYIRTRLQERYHLPYSSPTLHEVVFSDRNQKAGSGVDNMAIAKRLIDHGFHPPTVSFPLIVKGALMIEPTETESPESIEALCQAFLAIADEVESDPETVQQAPHRTFMARLDETRAARQPILTYADLLAAKQN